MALKEAITRPDSINLAGQRGVATSSFGWLYNPWGGGESDWHPGIDIANDYGTQIVTTADREVIFSGWFGG